MKIVKIAGFKRISIVDPSSKNNNDLQFLMVKEMSKNDMSILDDIGKSISHQALPSLKIPRVSFEI